MTRTFLYIDNEGRRGSVTADFDGFESGVGTAEIHLENAQTLTVPTSRLVLNPSGTVSLRPLEEAENIPPQLVSVVIPVVEEQPELSIERVATGKVEIRKVAHDRDEVIHVPLVHEHFDIKRVPVNRPVDGPVPVRIEGETTIYPVLEEIVVITKQWMLCEEVHVTKRIEQSVQQRTVRLRREEVVVERSAPDAP